MREEYPSDLSKKAFEQIRPLLEQVRKQTKPRKIDLYDVFCGVLYLLKSGCQWRMLPSEFPKWRTVHSYFAKWSEPDQDGVSALERALKKSGWRGPYQRFLFNLNRHFRARCRDRRRVSAVASRPNGGEKIAGGFAPLSLRVERPFLTRPNFRLGSGAPVRQTLKQPFEAVRS